MRPDIVVDGIAKRIAYHFSELPTRFNKPPKNPGTNYAVVYLLDTSPGPSSLDVVHDSIDLRVQIKIVSTHALRAAKQADEICRYLVNTDPIRLEYELVNWVRTSPPLDVPNTELQEVNAILHYRIQALPTEWAL